MGWQRYNPTKEDLKYLNELWQFAHDMSAQYSDLYKKQYGENYADDEDWFSDVYMTPLDKPDDWGASVIQPSGPRTRGIREYRYCDEFGTESVTVREHFGAGKPTEWFISRKAGECDHKLLGSSDQQTTEEGIGLSLNDEEDGLCRIAAKDENGYGGWMLSPELPDEEEPISSTSQQLPRVHSSGCFGGHELGCGPDDTRIPDENIYVPGFGRGLPPELGGSSGISPSGAQRWVRRLLEMENGKNEAHIIPSGGPAPIDPAEPDSPRPRGTLPPPHPADPRRIRPTDPDEFTGGVVGQTVMTLAKKTFPEIFAGEQVMPSSTGPRPFDPIYDEKRRGTMIPPKDWNPYGPRTRINSMLLPDDIQGARSKR